MKELLNEKLCSELELDRSARSFWEKVFRCGVYYLLITTLLGSLAEMVFGEHNGPMPFWGWLLVIPYLFFMLYCSNYAAVHFVKSKTVKVAWWCMMVFIVFVLTKAAIL